MQGLTGLSAIAGYQVLREQEAQATPEERLGGIADPRHANVGEQAQPYSWQSKATQASGLSPKGPENQLLSDPDAFFYESAGMPSDSPYFDNTPARRAAPFPKGVLSGPIRPDDPDAYAEQLRQSAALHAVKAGGSRKYTHTQLGDAQQDEWNDFYEYNPGTTLNQTPNRQAASGGNFMYGSRDRVTSLARQNEFGYDTSHMHRRYASGPIPGNTMWMRPGGRPLAKTLAGPARPPIGLASPFAGDDLGQAFGIDGALLQNVPTEYQAPIQPNLAAAGQVPVNDSIVEWY